jgi:hypothetical protein
VPQKRRNLTGLAESQCIEERKREIATDLKLGQYTGKGEEKSPPLGVDACDSAQGELLRHPPITQSPAKIARATGQAQGKSRVRTRKRDVGTLGVNIP